MRKLGLKEIQYRELQIFRMFVELCEKYGLRYYLAGGTLLGAARHKGFIPWDDDIDVNMPREDYDLLLTHAGEISASGDYKLVACELGNLNYPFAKIYDLHTDIKKLYDDDDTERNLWIDIFPMDGLPDDDRKVREIFGKTLAARRILRVKQARSGEGKTAVKRALKPLIKAILKPLDDKKLLSYINRTCRTYKIDDCHYMGGIANGYGPQERVPRNPYLKSVPMPFEDMTVSAPGCWDYYLRSLYGDYMQLPPEEKRKTHSMDVWIRD
ncbi:MAG TPA: LicD family protein [Lachnospiraceae bacterium]|nr:LicD family protein [Lachnospiraceae bacterium]